MVKGIGDKMQEYLSDILATIGIISFSIGAFIINTAIGFIATGILLILVAFLISRGGD